jgi:hypothetical protein
VPVLIHDNQALMLQLLGKIEKELKAVNFKMDVQVDTHGFSDSKPGHT